MSLSFTRSLEKKRYAALVLAQSWQAIGILSPTASPICAIKSQNLLPNRASANSSPRDLTINPPGRTGNAAVHPMAIFSCGHGAPSESIQVLERNYNRFIRFKNWQNSCRTRCRGFVGNLKGQHTEYGEAARRWAAGGRKSGLLLRSPVLEEAERWIASRPRGAPEPTAETQAFVAESRRGASRRRNILTGSLAAGLVVALLLAGLAYWQREIAVQHRQIADQQRKRAEDTLAAATKTANGLVFDLAQRFRNSVGIPAALVKDILDRARALQVQLINSGQVTPALKASEAEALMETVNSRLTIGDTKGALSAAQQARQILADLVAGNPAAPTTSVSCRSLTRSSAMCRWRRASSPTRSTPIRHSAASWSVWRSPIPATPTGRTT